MTGNRAPFRVLLVAAAIFAVVMALLPHPPQVPGHIGDRWQHMAAFGTLTTLAVLGYPQASLLRIGERFSFLGALIELFQSIPALRRDCDVMDWLADTFVIVVVLVITRIVRRRRAATP